MPLFFFLIKVICYSIPDLVSKNESFENVTTAILKTCRSRCKMHNKKQKLTRNQTILRKTTTTTNHIFKFDKKRQQTSPLKTNRTSLIIISSFVSQFVVGESRLLLLSLTQNTNFHALKYYDGTMGTFILFLFLSLSLSVTLFLSYTLSLSLSYNVSYSHCTRTMTLMFFLLIRLLFLLQIVMQAFFSTDCLILSFFMHINFNKLLIIIFNTIKNITHFTSVRVFVFVCVSLCVKERGHERENERG